MMQAGNCEESRDRGLLGPDFAVGEDEDVDPVVDGGVCIFEEFFERGLEACAGDRWL